MADTVVAFDVENSGPAKKPKAGKKKPLAESNADNVLPGGKTIEQTYQKKSQLEHILLRPDTYVGSVVKQTAPLWVINAETGRFVQRDISYVPALYKIYDEIIVNAADNKVRDPTMDKLCVDIDQETGTISVWNNGNGVPVEIHKEEGVYVPEMIFGMLLTSSNYDDGEKKVTGGRNGYGAKLTNVFSTEFIIETADGARGRKYKQVFSNNMTEKSKPSITKCKETENWTKVTFTPDFTKFGMDHLEDDIVALMTKRVYDLAACIGKTVKLYLNGDRLKIRTFEDYVGMYLDSDTKRVYERVSDRWEVCVATSEGSFTNVSFVNSICTFKGGKHVDMIANQCIKKLEVYLKKKHKGTNVKPAQIKNHLWVFVNSMIENPAFDSQCKETLTTQPSQFGSTCELSEGFHKKLEKLDLVDNIVAFANVKAAKALSKTDGSKKNRLTGIPKLDDANDAGTKRSGDCTLILTEGDSAKALAISGLSVVGRDRYGVFPLRGKLLNVREASTSQIMGNAEINNIKQIMGLQQGKVYTDTKSLRYGHLMIMTDQDHDGSHIKGLLINFLHKFWPSLLKVPDFLVEFITPIVKATKGSKTHVFYTMPEYEAWKESLGGITRGWSIKYYKGLGTSTAVEAKEYFSELGRNRKMFKYEDENDDDSIDLVFSKKRIADRKEWLGNFTPGTYLDHDVEEIVYKDFVHKELILFSRADLERSVPSMVDGFKPGQRKILFSAFKRKLASDIKVAQLAGYVSEHAAYHHGEASLQSTIVNMAQTFVGSNNINLLVPSGQFGTRLQGGKDSASPRYIYTRLSPLTRAIFPEADDELLAYQNEEGQSIEPTWYLPILPMVLVNGASGIGTGWSSEVPNYDPRAIVQNIKHLLHGEEQDELAPWYKGFSGSIDHAPKSDSYISYGELSKPNETTLEISELPIRRWTQDCKDLLESMLQDTKENPAAIKDYKEYHTDQTVYFSISMTPDQMAKAEKEGLYKKFKCTSNISTSNMHLFDKDGLIKKYTCAEEVLADFFSLRLEYYGKRKVAVVTKLEKELLKLENKVRFILGVVKGEIQINNRKKADIIATLQHKGFDAMEKDSKAKADSEDSDETETTDAKLKSKAGKGYDYLLSMPIFSLTLEKVEELLKERDGKKDHLEDVVRTTPEQMWERDLDNFLEALDEYEEKEKADLHPARRGKKASKSKKDDDSDDDDYNPAAKKSKGKSAASKTKDIPVPSGVPVPKPPPPAAKPARSAKSAPSSSKATEQEKSEVVVDEAELSLAERLALRAKSKAKPTDDMEEVKSPMRPIAAKKPTKKGPAKKPAKSRVEEWDSDAEASDDDDFPVIAPGPSSKRAASGRAAAKKSVSYVDSDEEDDLDFTADSPTPVKPKSKAPAKKAAPAKKRAAPPATLKKAAKSPRKAAVAPSEEDASPAILPSMKVRRMRPSPFNKASGDIVSEGNDDEAVVKAAARPRRAAVKKTTVYVERYACTHGPYALNPSQSRRLSQKRRPLTEKRVTMSPSCRYRAVACTLSLDLGIQLS
eukprot:scaffold7976_cov403-Prasinococcus_capsulatus_cf.AAC.7